MAGNSFSASTLSTIGTYGQLASISYGAQTLSGKRGSNTAPTFQNSGALLNESSNVAPLPVVYGTRRVGGNRVFLGVSGGSNEYLTLVLSLCEGEVGSIGTVYIDDVDSTDAKFTGLVSITKYTGTATQAADPGLIADFPTQWTANHAGCGVAYVIVKMKYSQSVFSGLPTITVDVQGKKVYDPRTGLTGYSNNPALCIRDYLSNTIYGRGIDASFVDDATFIAAANYCDGMVSIPSGVQARYTCDGVVDVGQTAYNNMLALLTCCRGMLVYSGGLYKLRLDGVLASTFAFTEDNITGKWSIAQSGRRARFNRVSANYFNPANKWNSDIAVSDSPGYRVQDNNLLLQTTLDLPYTADSYRAQQLAGLHLKQSRFGVKCSFTAFQSALRCEVGDVVSITHSTPGWSAKLFRVSEVNMLDTDEVEVVAQEYDATVYNLDTLTAITSTPTLTLPDPFSVSVPSGVVLTSGTTELLKGGDGSIISRIKVSWQIPSSVFTTKAEVHYQLSTDTVWQALSLADAAQGAAWTNPVKDGYTYNVRVRFVSSTGVNSAWVTQSHLVAGKSAPPSTPSGVVVSVQQISFTGVSDFDLAGYQVRSAAGANPQWGAGVPLHTGVVTTIPFTPQAKLYGIQTVMVAAVDTSGNVGDFAWALYDFSTPNTGNVLYSTDYAAGNFPGTITGGAAAGGVLSATIAGSPDVYVLADEYSNADMYAATYQAAQWVSTAFVPRYNGTVTLVSNFTGAAKVEYQFDGGNGNDAYSLSDAYASADLFGASSVWAAWPGAMDVKRGQGLIFRVSLAAGSVQGTCNGFAVYFSMPLVRQTWTAQAIAAGGSRLAPAAGSPAYSQWVQVKTVQITPVADGSGAVNSQVLDMQAFVGPAVQLFNSSGTSVAGTATVDIGGFVDV